MRIVNPELRVRCHFFFQPPNPDSLTAAPQNNENLATFPEGIRKCCALNTDVFLTREGHLLKCQIFKSSILIEILKKNTLHIAVFLDDGLKMNSLW